MAGTRISDGTPTSISGTEKVPVGTGSGKTITTTQAIANLVLASPAFTGTPTAPTQAPGDNSTKIATTAYVDALTLTVGTGLTNTSGTLTADLATGKSGGQSVVGGTAAGNSLTLSSTSNATKGTIIFGASSYSEVNNTFLGVFNTQGSTMNGTWTGTAAGQTHLAIGPTITGRAGSGGNNDDYNIFQGNGTVTFGAGSSGQIGRVFYGTTTFSTGGGRREIFASNPTWTTPTSTDYLLHLQGGSTDRFQVDYSGNVTGSGATLLNLYSTSTIFGTPLLRVQTSGSNADLSIFNTGTNGLSFRFRSAIVSTVGTFTLNDQTNDIFTVASSAFTFNRSVALPYIAKTANYTLTSADYFVDATSNSFTLTLPTAVGITGRIYELKNSGTATTITVATTSSQTIDGSAPGTITTAVPLRVVSDGANWKTF